VPDAHDYRAFGDLLKRPELWSSQERAHVESTLQQQRQMLNDAHSKDAEGRRRLAAVEQEIEDAIERYDAR
jgi:hypothetical protein